MGQYDPIQKNIDENKAVQRVAEYQYYLKTTSKAQQEKDRYKLPVTFLAQLTVVMILALVLVFTFAADIVNEDSEPIVLAIALIAVIVFAFGISYVPWMYFDDGKISRNRAFLAYFVVNAIIVFLIFALGRL